MPYLCIEFLNNNKKPHYSEVDSVESCTGFIVRSVDDFKQLPTLHDIFSIPLVEDLQSMFMVGFSLPLIAYLTAWAFGILIEWLNEPEN